MGNFREFWGCYYIVDTIEISNIDCIRTIVSVQYTRHNKQISRFSCPLDSPPTIFRLTTYNIKIGIARISNTQNIAVVFSGTDYHDRTSYVNRNPVSNIDDKDSVDVALNWQPTFEFTTEQKQILTLDYYHESRRSEKRKDFMISSSAWQMRGFSW